MTHNAEARKRVPIFFSTGDDISEIKDASIQDLMFLNGESTEGLDLSALKTEVPSGYKVGLMHSHIAILFMDLWTWDGKIVLFKGDTYYDISIPQSEAINKYGKPFLYSFPLLLLILGGALIVYLLYMSLVVASSRKLMKKNTGYNISTPPTPTPTPTPSTPTPQPAPALESSRPQQPQGVPRPKTTVNFKKDFTPEELQQMYDNSDYQHALGLVDSEGLESGINHLFAKGINKTEARYGLKALLKAIQEAQADVEQEPLPV